MAMLHSHDVEGRIRALMAAKADPLGDPTEAEVWRAVNETAQEKELWLPTSYTVDSLLWLVPPHIADTTERSLVRNFRAFAATTLLDKPGDDPRPKKKPAPENEEILRRALYYTTPFITCTRCNSLLFIDANNARTLRAKVPPSVRLANGREDEFLVACRLCDTTATLRLGAHDLSAQMAYSKAELIRQIKRRNKASRKIGRFYRAYLRRVAARLRRWVGKIERMLIFKCAAVRQSVVRGRLGRRQASVERCLEYIRGCHPIAVQRALVGDGDVLGASEMEMGFSGGC